VVGAQTHWLLALHCWPDGHVPHGSVPPQPSLIEPQNAFCAWQVVGTHVHLLFTHVLPCVHAPQLTVPPQPSLAVPQSSPSEVHVAG
jgi:hypothetical protein